VIQKLADIAPFVVGGSADLAPSNNTAIKASADLAREESGSPPADAVFRGRNLHFGVREHAMGAMINGMTLYGCWRAYGGTFLIFSDYMRPSIRLAALMGIPSIFVFTHDSVFLGEDGPTHQPIEQLTALRAIPGLTLFRPADRVETAMAWAWAVGQAKGPTALALTRQKLEPLKRDDAFDPRSIWKGAYVLRENADAAITIVATGSEVPLAAAAAEKLAGMGIPSRVVSAPSLELFEAQGESYQSGVLGEDRSRMVVIEAGRTSGWYRWAAHDSLVIGVDGFGASAPAERIAEHFGFTPDAVAARVTKWLDARAL
jgi:transketolase